VHPSLATAGLARTEALRAALADFPLQAIFVSEYRRTAATAVQTADGTLFVLELPENLPPRLVRAWYGAPDSPQASACRNQAP
jgi:phosphohistidine phosphatase SixA